ncbi:hypothetical protein AKJ56_00980 [candidate division MSBL1 archaeon SCGC-AAA382N08]|uniref:Uncharacterized protein n=1 Tax=candidate division MSBL1 archaeon SCGC-AAA382N08 TaxID=1698285 RepID=A0A133VQ35_9EURY|nr:hypothetical protein AKJ56_00980 [candidate division MSBL1 archaeon SCGC-AAA382N08]
MAKAKENKTPKGFFRLQLTEGKDGKVVSDSGWKENQITDLGVQDYLVDWLVGDTANGKSVSHMALGTGGAPAAADTSLSGEVDKRAGVSTSIISSRTAQFTAAFASSDSFVTTTQNIANVGLFNTSAGGTIFAGNTYASSSCATNQNCNASYQIQFP